MKKTIVTDDVLPSIQEKDTFLPIRFRWIQSDTPAAKLMVIEDSLRSPQICPTSFGDTKAKVNIIEFDR
jgi:hypothetical protein